MGFSSTASRSAATAGPLDARNGQPRCLAAPLAALDASAAVAMAPFAALAALAFPFFCRSRHASFSLAAGGASARTVSLTHSTARPASTTARKRPAKRVRHSSPITWASCECVRLQNTTCSGSYSSCSSWPPPPAGVSLSLPAAPRSAARRRDMPSSSLFQSSSMRNSASGSPGAGAGPLPGRAAPPPGRPICVRHTEFRTQLSSQRSGHRNDTAHRVRTENVFPAFAAVRAAARMRSRRAARAAARSWATRCMLVRPCSRSQSGSAGATAQHATMGQYSPHADMALTREGRRACRRPRGVRLSGQGPPLGSSLCAARPPATSVWHTAG